MKFTKTKIVFMVGLNLIAKATSASSTGADMSPNFGDVCAKTIKQCCNINESGKYQIANQLIFDLSSSNDACITVNAANVTLTGMIPQDSRVNPAGSGINLPESQAMVLTDKKNFSSTTKLHSLIRVKANNVTVQWNMMYDDTGNANSPVASIYAGPGLRNVLIQSNHITAIHAFNGSSNTAVYIQDGKAPNTHTAVNYIIQGNVLERFSRGLGVGGAGGAGVTDGTYSTQVNNNYFIKMGMGIFTSRDYNPSLYFNNVYQDVLSNLFYYN